jgi:hypothetical protein
MAMNAKLAALVAAPAVALSVPGVQAQDGTTAAPNNTAPEPTNGPFSLRLGVNRLSDGETRDFVGGTDLFGGLSYGLKTGGRIDLDFNRQSDDGNDVNALGLSYTHLFPFGQQQKFYGGLGLGLYRVSADVRGTRRGGGGGGYYYLGLLGLGDPSGVDEDKVRLGGKALLGYNFSDKFFGEVAYTKIGKVEGADASNFSVALGLRF